MTGQYIVDPLYMCHLLVNMDGLRNKISAPCWFEVFHKLKQDGNKYNHNVSQAYNYTFKLIYIVLSLDVEGQE